MVAQALALDETVDTLLGLEPAWGDEGAAVEPEAALVDLEDSELEGLPAGTSREQLVIQIRLMNPGATRELLDSFGETHLACYLAHLKTAQQPRIGSMPWVRSGETRGITRRFADAE